MSKIQLTALRNFSGPDGKYYIHEVFEAKSEERAKFLIEGGYAKRATKVEEKAAAAATAEVAQPSAAPKATASKAA